MFDLQDQITERVVGIVEPDVFASQRSNDPAASDRKASTLMTFICALCPTLRSISIGNVPIAAGFLRDALELDPNYPAAHAYLAWAHQISYSHGGLNEADRIAGLRHSRAAIANDVDDATALAVGANVIGLLGKDA